MTTRPPQRPPQLQSTALSRACDRVSRVGICLIPGFYVGFVALLLLLWHLPARTYWLSATAAALAGAMGLWSLAFYLASSMRANESQPAAPRAVEPLEAKRAVPLRFVQMTTRTCSQACATPTGAQARFTVSCFYANCAVSTPATSDHAGVA